MNACSVIRQVETDEKVMAVTFDDGPHPDFTLDILDILEDHQARSTFFMAGEFIGKFPELVAEVNRRGHEIGNHTRTHPDLTQLDKDGIFAEMRWPHQEICRLTGAYPALFRPPYGKYNEHVLDACAELGCHLVVWSDGLEMFDWEMPGVDALVDTLLRHARPGCIALLHDYGGDRSQTVAALREAIPLLRGQGYRLCTVSQLMALGGRGTHGAD